MKLIPWRALLGIPALMALLWISFSAFDTAAFGKPGDGPPPGNNQPGNNQPGNNQPGPPAGNGNRPSNRQNSSPLAQLGKAIFFDPKISNPTGMSCASCHAPETGFNLSQLLHQQRRRRRAGRNQQPIW